jgi:hypothetical protein
MYIQPKLLPEASLQPEVCLAKFSATSVWLSLYKPVSSSRNAACSQQILKEGKIPQGTIGRRELPEGLQAERGQAAEVDAEAIPS